MRAVVFVNGVVIDYSALEAWLREDDYLIGADGGTVHCLAVGRCPHAIVGDLDSVEPDLLEELRSQGTLIERYPAGKDQTDLELAMEHALCKGADELLLLGAMGGRPDQTLANLLILAQRVWPVPVRLAEDDQIAQVLHGGEKLALTGRMGSTVSLIPLSAEVTGVTYRGLQYPLSNASLRLGSTRAISNVLVEMPATIQIETGMALVFQTVSMEKPRR